MTVTATTTSPAATGSNPATGRNIYNVGNRIVGRFHVSLSSTYVTGGIPWDPQTYGFPYRPAEVRFATHVLVASVLVGSRYLPGYDFVNKKITVFDVTDGDEPNGDDLTGVAWDIEVISE